MIQDDWPDKHEFLVGWCPEKGTVTIEFKCCDHEDKIGVECIHYTPEKAVFLAQMLLEKVLSIYWSKKDNNNPGS